jgi:hypothetical protein
MTLKRINQKMIVKLSNPMPKKKDLTCREMGVLSGKARRKKLKDPAYFKRISDQNRKNATKKLSTATFDEAERSVL